MFGVYDDSGKPVGGRILSEADATLQIELDSGKRVKVKAVQLLLRFDKPQPAELLRAAQALAQGFDLDLAWEFAPEGEFGFADLAGDYFGSQAAAEQLACWLALSGAPHYFRRAGKGGQFRKAPQEQVQAALAGIEKKRQQAAQMAHWADELAAGRCPPEMQAQIYKLLFKPDKNGPEYKALVQAALASKTAPLDLLSRAGAIQSPYAFHWQRFLFEQFPKGTGFPALPDPQPPADLPLAAQSAFSIDDSSTTEIDDALSVQGLGTGEVCFGIHIAAPGLALQPGSPHDEQVARARLSTVYLPGWKLTMLPDAWVEQFTLTEGRDCPALSLYCRFDEATLALKGSETRLERVRIAANLRLPPGMEFGPQAPAQLLPGVDVAVAVQAVGGVGGGCRSADRTRGAPDRARDEEERETRRPAEQHHRRRGDERRRHQLRAGGAARAAPNIFRASTRS